MSNQKALGQISYLIQLLTDRDEVVRQKVRAQLIELGEDALPFLEMAVRKEEVALRIQAQEVISAIFPKKLGSKNTSLMRRGRSLKLYHSWKPRKTTPKFAGSCPFSASLKIGLYIKVPY